MWIVKASLKNPHAVVVLVLMIVFLGAFAASNIAVGILPVFKAPAVQTLTYFQGMPASSIEKTITNRIERWVNQAPGARKVESKSVPGVSIVKTYFRDDIDPNAALTLTTSLAQGTLPTLPPNTLPPVVLPFDPTGTIPLGILTVSNSALDEAHVKDLARIDVRNMLGDVPGCVAPVVVGGKDRTILIYLRPKDLEARNLSPLDVVRALQKGNLMVTPGTAYFGNNQILLDTNVMVRNVEELNHLPIRMAGPDDTVYLEDIGSAEDSYAIQTSRVHINDRREVYVPIYRQQGASSLAVARAVKDKIKRMEKLLPTGTKLEFVMDQTVYVSEAIQSLIHEGVIGAVLVSIMILIFLGNRRMTMIASMSIPLAIFCAIVGLYATNNTINAMTLGGLALAIGPLVDDAIVVLENTHRHHSLGKSRLRAAFDGAVEVTIPVLVATATTIIVLCPIAFMPGMGGFLFRPLMLAVAFAMISSFILSRTFVPMLCAKWLGGHHHAGEEYVSPGLGARVYRRIDLGLNHVTRKYERLLAWTLQRRTLVLTSVAILFVGALTLVLGIGQEFFPQVDAGQLTLYVRAPSDSRLDATERRVAALEKFLREPEHIAPGDLEMIVTEMGLDPDWSAAYTANSGQQDAVIRIQLTDKRMLSAQEYAIKLRTLINKDPRFADLRVAFDTGGMISAALNYGASSPIDIEITGGSPEQAGRLAKKIRTRIADVRGTADVRVLQRLDAPYKIIDVKRQEAAFLGLSAQDVILQVVAAMNSSVSINRNFWIDTKTGNQYFVAVQYPENPNMTMDDVLDINATGTNQAQVKLRTLVDVHDSTGEVEVNHVNLYRTFDVLVNTENRDIGSVAKDLDNKLAGLRPELDQEIDQLLKRRDGLRKRATPVSNDLIQIEKDIAGLKSLDWKLKGEYARMNSAFGNLGRGLLFASVLVYLLMVPLFRSYLGPFIIMFTVPLGLIGVLTMLFVTHTTLNVQSAMGVIFLVGIVVSNGVLLVDFANKQRKMGLSVYQAITTAAAIRFRPIMMTFLATFLDLLPMAIGMGRGSEANIPLARAVVGGLLTSTFLTLIVVPTLYTLFIRENTGDEIDIDKELSEQHTHGPALALATVGETTNGDLDKSDVTMTHGTE
jgi:multidrug efflux pump subunit AcrB